MKYKTLCRLLVRLIGLYFMAWGTADMLRAVGSVILNASYRPAQYTMQYHLNWLATQAIGYLPVGIILFFSSSWIADKLIPSNRPYCHECGYDLTGSVGNVCAECGTAFKSIVKSVEPHH